MNLRGLRSSMGSSREPAVPAYRRLRMPRKRPQVLGVDLNRSESRWGRADPSCAVTQMIAHTIPRETFLGSCGCDHERAPTAAQVRSAQPCQVQGIVVAF